MKRTLSLMLCALLLGILPLADAPARAITADFSHTASPPLHIGDTVTLSFSNETGTGPFICDDNMVYYYSATFDTYVALSAGNPYTFSVHMLSDSIAFSGTARDQGDSSVFSAESPRLSLRLRPASGGLKAAPSSPLGTSLKLSWGAVPGATGHEVWKSAAAEGPYTLLRQVTATALYDTALTPGSPRYYRVRAYNYVPVWFMNDDIPSGEFADAAGAPTGSSAISALSATGRDRALLAWTAAPGATAYKVWVSKSPAAGYTLARTTAAASLTVTGLAPNSYCFFKVQPYRQAYPAVFDGPMSGCRAVRTLK